MAHLGTVLHKSEKPYARHRPLVDRLSSIVGSRPALDPFRCSRRVDDSSDATTIVILAFGPDSVRRMQDEKHAGFASVELRLAHLSFGFLRLNIDDVKVLERLGSAAVSARPRALLMRPKWASC